MSEGAQPLCLLRTFYILPYIRLHQIHQSTCRLTDVVPRLVATAAGPATRNPRCGSGSRRSRLCCSGRTRNREVIPGSASSAYTIPLSFIYIPAAIHVFVFFSGYIVGRRLLRVGIVGLLTMYVLPEMAHRSRTQPILWFGQSDPHRPDREPRQETVVSHARDHAGGAIDGRARPQLLTSTFCVCADLVEKWDLRSGTSGAFEKWDTR